MSGVVFPLFSVQFSDAIGILSIPPNILAYTRPEEKDNLIKWAGEIKKGIKSKPQFFKTGEEYAADGMH